MAHHLHQQLPAGVLDEEERIRRRNMTREQMYGLLREKAAQTDWNNPQSIKAYNEYARMLRHMIEEE